LIAEPGRLKNNDNVSGIHYFWHKGQTRIIWKTENEVGAGCALKMSGRREGKKRSVRNEREVKQRKWGGGKEEVRGGWTEREETQRMLSWGKRV